MLCRAATSLRRISSVAAAPQSLSGPASGGPPAGGKALRAGRGRFGYPHLYGQGHQITDENTIKALRAGPSEGFGLSAGGAKQRWIRAFAHGAVSRRRMGARALRALFCTKEGIPAGTERKSMRKLVKSDKRTEIRFAILLKRHLAFSCVIVHNAITAVDAHLSVKCGHNVGKR